MDEFRNRFLRDRVLTATPAQRVVMLYDRLALDLVRARAAEAPEQPGPHLSHAIQIVAELIGSLDHSTGQIADNLAGLYHYLLKVLMEAQITQDLAPVGAAAQVVENLRSAWTTIAEPGTVPAAGGLPGALPGSTLVGSSWTA